MEKHTLEAIAAIIAEAEAMRGAYFYQPPGSAGMRRWYEKQHSHALVEWSEGGHSYTASYTVSCSCRNVYANGEYTRDGRKTTLTAVRNSYLRLKAAAGKLQEVSAC